MIADADWIVDLGPGAAAEGGRIVAQGPPSAIMEAEASHTGAHLEAYLESLERADRPTAEHAAPVG